MIHRLHRFDLSGSCSSVLIEKFALSCGRIGSELLNLNDTSNILKRVWWIEDSDLQRLPNGEEEEEWGIQSESRVKALWSQ